MKQVSWGGKEQRMKKLWGKRTPAGETAGRCERKRARGERLEENKDERLILGSGRALDECFLLPGFVYRKFFWEDRWLHSLKSFLLHFSKAYKLPMPPFMRGETLIGTTGAAAATPVLTQTRPRLQRARCWAWFEEFVSPLTLSVTTLLHVCGTHRVSPAWN